MVRALTLAVVIQNRESRNGRQFLSFARSRLSGVCRFIPMSSV